MSGKQFNADTPALEVVQGIDLKGYKVIVILSSNTSNWSQ